MHDVYEVFAVKYAERNARSRRDSFIFDDDHASPHPMDYFVWVIRNQERTIVVDTGYDQGEGARRDRPVLTAPAAALRLLDIDAARVETVIITHLHYDHAGTLADFPAAKFHLQAAEMAFATGPCMCHDTLRMPYTADHVCDMVRHVYSGRVQFHDGDASIAPGIELLAIGGHSRGLQAVRVKTQNGWMVLASDAAHYYENFVARKPFPIVADLEPMLRGFDTLETMSSTRELIIPGHDPLVRAAFLLVAGDKEGVAAHRLDVAPKGVLQSTLAGFT